MTPVNNDFSVYPELHPSQGTSRLRSWAHQGMTTTMQMTWRLWPNATNTVNISLFVETSSSIIINFFLSFQIMNFVSSHVCSNAIWQREILLLPIPHQRAAMDLAPDPLLHHLPPVELQTRVYCLHTHCCQVHQGMEEQIDLSSLTVITTYIYLPAFYCLQLF